MDLHGSLKWAVLLLVFLEFKQGYSTQTTCHFDPSEVSDGESTVLSCVFPLDVSTHKNDFMVQFSNDSIFAVDEDLVVDCKWSETEPYSVSDICPLKDIFNRTVKLGFGKVSSANEGYYRCLMMADPTKSDSEYCRLTLKALQPGKGGVQLWVIVVVGVSVGLILVAVIAGAVCFCKRRCGGNTQRQPRRNPNVDDSKLPKQKEARRMLEE